VHLSCSQRPVSNSRQTDFTVSIASPEAFVLAMRAAICLSLAGNGSNVPDHHNFGCFIRGLRAPHLFKR
jgi:hypothetical protein